MRTKISVLVTFIFMLCLLFGTVLIVKQASAGNIDLKGALKEKAAEKEKTEKEEKKVKKGKKTKKVEKKEKKERKARKARKEKKAELKNGVAFKLNDKDMVFEKDAAAKYNSFDQRTKVMVMFKDGNVDIIFPEDKPGKWEQAGFSCPNITLNLGKETYAAKPGDPILIEVKEYEKVGGRIRGSFSGVLYDLDTQSKKMEIKDGRFNVERKSDM